MKSSSQTTYILLERGVEDKELLEELNRIVIELGLTSIKTFFGVYPTLYELWNSLKEEIKSQEL